jgi:hypothetical protein
VLRSGGLWRTVASRGRADWPVVLAAWLLLLCAISLLSAGALYGDTVALGGLRRTLLAAPPADSSIAVRMSAATTEVDAFDGIVAPELARGLGPSGGEVAELARSGSFRLADLSLGDGPHGAVLASYQHIEAHATLVDGRWPVAAAQPIEAALSEGAAAALGLRIGDETGLVGSLENDATTRVRVIGIWRPDPIDPYWQRTALELDGVEARGSFTAHGPFIVARDDLFAHPGGRLDVEWRAIPDIEALQLEQLPAMETAAGELRARLRAALLPRSDFTVTTALPTLLADVDRSILVSRSEIGLLTLQFAVLAGYAVLLVAGMIVERRRAEVALLRSRGATTGHLALMGLLEGLFVAVPAAILAPLVALAAVDLVGSLGPLAKVRIVDTARISGVVVVVAAITALVCVLAFTLPTLTSGSGLSGVRASIGRQLNRTLAQRLGLDLALVLLAGIAMWQLRLYGAPLTKDARGVLGIDPLLVAAPAMGLVAGALLATRIVPRLAEIAERVLVRARGLVPPLGARQVARRPLRYTRSALLLMLAAALGTLAAAHAATWSRSQEDRAAYQAAADVRVIQSSYGRLPDWAIGPAYRAVSGVTAAMPVTRRSFDLGRTINDGVFVGLDSTKTASVATLPVDGGSEPVNSLLERLRATAPQSTRIEIPGSPRRLSVNLDANLVTSESSPGGAVSGPSSLDVAVVLEDGDGRLRRLEGDSGAIDKPGQRIVIPLTGLTPDLDVGLAAPLRLAAIELTVTTAVGITSGSIEVRGVAASDLGNGDNWTDLAFDPNAVGWAWFATRPFEPDPFTRTGVGPRLEVPDADGIFGQDNGSPPAHFSLRQPESADPLPAIVGTRFLEVTGLRIGETTTAEVTGQRLPLRVVGTMATFPPLDPTVPFVIVDGTSLDAAMFAGTEFTNAPEEWWLTLDKSQSDPAGLAASVSATVTGQPYGAASVVARTQLAATYAGDPLALGVIGALALGSLASLAFAAIGFVFSATVATNERLGEFALLQALGISSRQLSVWMAVESALLLAFGLVAGSALGLLLAWLILPFATLTETGQPAVPTPVVVIPWEAIVPLYALAIVLLAVTILIINRQLPRIQLSGALRARDE